MTDSQGRGIDKNTASLTFSPRILVVKDAKENVIFLSELLKKFGQIGFALDGETAIRSAEQVPLDLIMLDIEMPGMDGLEVLRRFRVHENLHTIPVIVVTGRSQENDEEAGLKLGANDYITTPFNPTVMEVRVKKQLLLRRYAWELEQANKKLEVPANTDYLTGAYNRRFFLNQLDSELLRCKRYHRDATVMVLNIEHIKNTDDSHGYLLRDEVLVNVYNSVKHVLRVQDTLGRMESDGLGLLVLETDLQGAKTLSERILTEVRNTQFESGEGVSRCTISIGVASLNSNSHSCSDVLIRADNALQIAMQSGHHGHIVVDGSADQTAL
ncbi:MAG: diguanylate cyclase [Alphaproteobacteria bacterium]